VSTIGRGGIGMLMDERILTQPLVHDDILQARRVNRPSSSGGQDHNTVSRTHRRR
jgi:hypothetical protein